MVTDHYAPHTRLTLDGRREYIHSRHKIFVKNNTK